jgi:hypothetical protein
MKNNIETTTTSISIVEIVGKIRDLSGAVALALGLVIFMIWFGWSINSYLGNIAPRGESQKSVIVASAPVVPPSF